MSGAPCPLAPSSWDATPAPRDVAAPGRGDAASRRTNLKAGAGGVKGAGRAARVPGSVADNCWAAASAAGVAAAASWRMAASPALKAGSPRTLETGRRRTWKEGRGETFSGFYLQARPVRFSRTCSTSTVSTGMTPVPMTSRRGVAAGACSGGGERAHRAGVGGPWGDTAPVAAGARGGSRFIGPGDAVAGTVDLAAEGRAAAATASGGRIGGSGFASSRTLLRRDGLRARAAGAGGRRGGGAAGAAAVTEVAADAVDCMLFDDWRASTVTGDVTGDAAAPRTDAARSMARLLRPAIGAATSPILAAPTVAASARCDCGETRSVVDAWRRKLISRAPRLAGGAAGPASWGKAAGTTSVRLLPGREGAAEGAGAWMLRRLPPPPAMRGGGVGGAGGTAASASGASEYPGAGGTAGRPWIRPDPRFCMRASARGLHVRSGPPLDEGASAGGATDDRGEVGASLARAGFFSAAPTPRGVVESGRAGSDRRAEASCGAVNVHCKLSVLPPAAASCDGGGTEESKTWELAGRWESMQAKEESVIRPDNVPPRAFFACRRARASR